MIDDDVTRMNLEVARNLKSNLTDELLDELDRLPPIFPQRISELSVAIREADRIEHRLRRQLLMEVAG